MKPVLNGLFAARKFLVVDDDPVFSETVETVLEREGGEIAKCNDGAEALDYLSNNCCDLAIVDLIMPKVDGLRLISILRHMPSTKSLPIVVITSRHDKWARIDTERLDVALFLTKPVQWTKFVPQICDVLEGVDYHCPNVQQLRSA